MLVEVKEVEGLQAGVEELSTAHSFLTCHALGHTIQQTLETVPGTDTVASPDLSLESMLATLKGLAMSAMNSTAPTPPHQLQLSKTLKRL